MVTVVKLIPTMSAIMQFLTFWDFANSKNGSQSSVVVEVKRFTLVLRMHYLPLVVTTFKKDLLIVWFDIITVA